MASGFTTLAVETASLRAAIEAYCEAVDAAFGAAALRAWEAAAG